MGANKYNESLHRERICSTNLFNISDIICRIFHPFVVHSVRCRSLPNILSSYFHFGYVVAVSLFLFKLAYLRICLDLAYHVYSCVIDAQHFLCPFLLRILIKSKKLLLLQKIFPCQISFDV